MAQRTAIDDLGGAKKVGEALRARGVVVADVTVRSWSLEGRCVPAKYWTHLVAIGRDTGKDLSFERLARAAEYKADASSVAA